MSVNAQFQLNGDAFASSDSCFVITPDQQTQSGNMWTMEKINLAEPFDFRFRMYFGNKDAEGADGFVFALQPLSNTIGGTGGGLGFAGISPSFGVEFDTYQNSDDYNDPAADHVAILQNGNVSHWSATGATLAGPVDISPNSIDVEDDQFHWVRFKWNPNATLFEVYYDCEQRLSYQGDIINTVFGGDSLVFWGVTGGTGLYHNRQEVCLLDLGVEEHFLEDQSRCSDDSISLQTHISGVYTYKWTPNYNIISSTISNPIVFPDSSISYKVEIKDECENMRYDSITINVPHAIDTIPDTAVCEGEVVVLETTTLGNATYTWNDNLSDSARIHVTESGEYIVAVTEYNCVFTDTVNVLFEECKEKLVPNIFSPNDDGINDRFDLSEITGDDLNWNLSVYNRWGKLVYEQLGYDHQWDGDALSDGLYLYEISLLGTAPTKGWVQLVR